MASKVGASAIRVPEMEKMSLEQLKALKEQSDLEVNLLQDSLNNIRTATVRLEIASNALHDLSLRPQGFVRSLSLSLSLAYNQYSNLQSVFVLLISGDSKVVI
uniref:Prefoldin subunit 5 n=1 Tax=Nelumbo nucifera TaxID=4432 RepID=A0A822YXA2_NELNU|nr:TPA_asm: hypothetical protein HUJ06_006599 [Nelumbo nucifera]